jgi:hypothetical protein
MNQENFPIFVQTTIFSEDGSAFDPAKVLSIILPAFAQRFNGEVQVLPLPPDVPQDIPRVILKSQDEVLELFTSINRMSASWRYQEQAQPNLHEIILTCSEVLKHYSQQTNLASSRIALITHHLIVSEAPIPELMEAMTTEQAQEFFQNPAHFEVFSVMRNRAEDFGWDVNHLLRLKSVTLRSSGQPALQIEQDINTSEFVKYQFRVADLENFTNFAEVTAEETVTRYLEIRKRNSDNGA